jgi:hypothetical protein
MTQYTVELTLGSDVANGGTFTVSYPTGTDAGAFEYGTGHYIMALGAKFSVGSSTGISLSFGTSSITVTYNGATTIPSGSTVFVNLDQRGALFDADDVSLTALLATEGVDIKFGSLVHLNLGAPDVADPNGVCESQAGTASTAMTLDGALVSGGVATFDKPRNIVAAWTSTAVLTVVGTDIYGNVISESSASGTSMAGKKAFKTVTSVTPYANITGATVGSGDVLGLPIYLPSVAYVLKELQDDAAASAGTVVAGLAEGTAATATNADVRGTYDPNSACDGAKVFELVCAIPDPTYTGVSQYAG